MNIFQRTILNISDFLKAKSPKTVPVKRLAHREDGTTYYQTFWVSPQEAKAGATSGAQRGLFDEEVLTPKNAQLGFDLDEPEPVPEKKKAPRLGIRVQRKEKAPEVATPAAKPIKDLFSEPPKAEAPKVQSPPKKASMDSANKLPELAIPDDMRARIILDSRPEGVPEGWAIFNAARPLSGTKTWQGEFVSGIYYAAINPADRNARNMLKFNVQSGSDVLVYPGEHAYAEARRAELIQKFSEAPEKHAQIRGFSDEKIILHSPVSKLSTYKDVKSYLAAGGHVVPEFSDSQPVVKEQEQTIPKAEPVPAIPVPAPDPVSTTDSAFSLPIAKTTFKDYGSWSASGKHLSPKARATLNEEVASLILKPRDEITEEEKDKIRRYSGFGGVSAEDERGVLYDFYTSPPVAKMTWKLLDSIDPIKPGDSILEPACGTGVFFETAPEGLAMTGVEIDTRTASCAAILQDKAKIRSGSFEEFNLSNNEEFDRIVGNAPFGDRSVLTSFMDMPEEGSMDRYFMRRSLDRLAPGGTMGMIVHPGVMSGKLGEAWRADMCRHGQFMGAVKLPDKSFKHTSTQVQPDIIFFRKYPAEVELRLEKLSDKQFKETPFCNADWTAGTYFKNHKDHILGTLQEGAGQWGSDVVSGSLSHEDMDKAIATFKQEPPIPAEALKALDESSPTGLPASKPVNTILTEQEASAVAAKTLTVGMTKTMNGKVYRLNKNHRWELVDTDAETATKIDSVKAIAGKVKAIREAMQTKCPVDELQRDARTKIQKFIEMHGTSTADDPEVKKFLKENPSTAGIFEGLVGIDDAILTKESIYDAEIELVDGHQPEITALRKIQENMARATLENIHAYFPNQAESLIASMKASPDVFLAADGAWELREDFISGDGRKKVKELKALIQEHPDWKDEADKWQYGIDEIEKTMGWIGIEDANIIPQAAWVPDDIVDAWVQAEGYHVPSGYKLGRNSDGKWGYVTAKIIKVPGRYVRDGYGYGGHYEEEYEIPVGEWEEASQDIVYFLNGQKQRSKNIDTEFFNAESLDAFRMWVASNNDARERLESLFNEKFNNEISAPTKTYSVNIEGWDHSRKTLNKAQWQSIHHLYRAGKGISALGTGFGKTLAAIALFGIMRQEGKTKRGFFQVPNNKVKDWVEEFKVMPGLRVGFIDPETKGYQNQATRYKMYQDLANGEWDVIILPESAASEIQLSSENDAEITESIVEGQITDRGTARKNQKAKDSAESKMESGKTNRTITFEDLGCDTLFTDEGHRYKNLYTSSLSRETGMNDGRRSDRAMSLFKKNEYIRRKNGGTGTFMLTATPLTNSPLEYYNMLMHIAPEELAAKGIKNIDEFINTFAHIEQGPKYDWGTGKQSVGKILRGFWNLQTLQSMFFKYTDLQNDPTKIDIKKPTPHNRPNILTRDHVQALQVKKLGEELERFKKMSKEARDASGENFLTFYSRVRTASLDLELYDPERYKGWVNPKIEKMADNAMQSYTATGGGQMVFCDRVMSGDGSFNMHNKIRDALVAKGFKESEIVVVNGLTKSGKKSDSAIEKEVSAAVEGFKSGKYKVIIGTTPMIGEGVNMQKNAAALHHMDVPYRPSDFIQRNGRIDRQGNQQKNVELHTYLAAGTIDSYSVSLVTGKANWIDKLLKTKSDVFVNPDDDQFVDADEILLALSEEFGDDDDVTARKEAMALLKAEKVKEANLERIHNNMSALSMIRSSMRNFAGDKGSKEYQNLLRKQSVAEKALASIPEFHDFSLIGEKPEPFSYVKRIRKLIREGDCIMSPEGLFKVDYLLEDKQDAKLMHFKNGNKPEFHRYTWNATIGTMNSRPFEKNDPDYYVVLPEKTMMELREKLIANDYQGFFDAPHSIKEQFYKVFSSMLSDYRFYEDGGKVNTNAAWSQEKTARLLNPYNQKDRIKIQEALDSGWAELGMYKGDKFKAFLDAGLMLPKQEEETVAKSIRIIRLRRA